MDWLALFSCRRLQEMVMLKRLALLSAVLSLLGTVGVAVFHASPWMFGVTLAWAAAPWLGAGISVWLARKGI